MLCFQYIQPSRRHYLALRVCEGNSEMNHRKRGQSLLLLRRPDMAFAVDWALKPNYLSVCLSACVACLSACLPICLLMCVCMYLYLSIYLCIYLCMYHHQVTSPLRDIITK